MNRTEDVAPFTSALFSIALVVHFSTKIKMSGFARQIRQVKLNR
jgi:hypothetical protein